MGARLATLTAAWRRWKSACELWRHKATRRPFGLGAVSRWLRNARYRWFVKVTGYGPEDRIVDVGCGRGAFLEARHPRLDRVLAVDLREGMLRELRARHPQLRVVVASADRMPFGDGAFDIALSNAVLEHLPDAIRRRAAGEIVRIADRHCVIVPNGRFPLEVHFLTPFIHWLSTPRFRRCLQWLSRLRLLRLRPDYPLAILTPSEIRRLFPASRVGLLMAGAHIGVVGRREPAADDGPGAAELPPQ